MKGLQCSNLLSTGDGKPNQNKEWERKDTWREIPSSSLTCPAHPQAEAGPSSSQQALRDCHDWTDLEADEWG